MVNENFSMYEVTPNTLALISNKIDGRYVTQLLEDREYYYIKKSPSKVMDLACKFFGSSLKGRQDGVKDMCNFSNKVPICIDPSSGMYFFPTSSPQNANCSWVAHSHIDQIKKLRSQSTQITFKNGQSIVLAISHGSLLNQIQRTAQYRYLLDKRIKYLMQTNNADMVAESN
ncbi:competence protein ComK [Aquibacillus sediminis]|uniref:competence protein ComK n=1 Tax=Aquibacillus sediminis TaxID=2574734 RepID=UPI001109BF98|nr:competence protein ComK [Aquibacillus sediminis]